LCGWNLSRAGVNCVLIEENRLMEGVSGRTTAKLTAQHGLIYEKLLKKFGPEKTRLYYEANRDAVAAYRKLAEQADFDLVPEHNYVYATEDTEKLEGEMAACQVLGISARWETSLPLPFPVAGAICFPDQAQFHPVKLAAHIAKGLKIYEKTKALAFLGNRVQTPQGTITAKKIIVATHFPMLNKHGAYFLKLYQHRSYVLALEGAEQVDGMYLDAAKDGLSFRNYGELLLLGGGGHRSGRQGGGWEELAAFARRHYPRARIKYRWATQDTMSLDGLPYIGLYGKQTPNLYAAAGFNKWGMTSSMAAAMLLGDLVQNRPNPWAELFCPSRSLLRPQLAANALEAAVSLVTPTKPRCPHMGCALKWNASEDSWDCPCHGSRFARSGELLQGPATGDMKKE